MTKFIPNTTLSPAATRDACQSAIDELQDADKKAAKELLKGRLKEVERLRTLLAKAEKDLETLLQKDVSEIAALRACAPKLLGSFRLSNEDTLFADSIPTQSW